MSGATERQWLDTAGAAHYLSLHVATFARKVRAGVVPAATYSLGDRSPRWHRAALDAMMRPEVSASDINSRVQAFVAFTKKARQKIGPRRQKDAGGRVR